MKALIVVMFALTSFSAFSEVEFQPCSDIAFKKDPRDYAKCMRQHPVKPKEEKKFKDCSAIDASKYPDEYKLCLRAAIFQDDSSSLRECSREKHKSITCPEGSYIFISGDTGKRILDVLGRKNDGKDLGPYQKENLGLPINTGSGIGK